MATSSILGADRAPSQAPGRDVEALGPSDTSDSGSDVQGKLDLASPIDLDNSSFGNEQPGLASDSDSAGTGERGAALIDEEAQLGADLQPDQVEDVPATSAEAGKRAKRADTPPEDDLARIERELRELDELALADEESPEAEDASVDEGHA